jgi:hypothetical protein
MTSVTRTVNPLHFEDLEPKRFEDLIRQLAYDFKNWRRLEATGRSGSDDGFDARGYEQIGSGGSASSDDDEDGGSDEGIGAEDRLWLIQCKREKSITPSKMRAHLAEIRITEPLYGVIFAAACDFSKATRDVLAAWCRDNGISEWHLWGKAELEDQLLQPKNDGILFAYFGISFAIRRRSNVSEIRRQVAIKRKLAKLVDGRTALLRDVDDDQYPFPPDDGAPPNWRVRELRQLTSMGLLVRVSVREAWLSSDGEEWDAALESEGQGVDNGQDTWHERSAEEKELDRIARESWRAFPDAEKAWLYTEGYIPYSQIMLIDDIGDDEFQGPHIFIAGWNDGFAMGQQWIESMEHPKRHLIFTGADTPGRAARFPEQLRHRSLRKLAF